ncbi:MAG TPA: hypothetical protein VNI54_10530 [Thermoanaerobaculia bacterium]|nr:hypothetical protein [Thermoanaerobaculia bacterium]
MTSEIAALLQMPASREVGRQLLDWVDGLRGRILRGDMTVGILSVADVEQAPAALRRAAECGFEEAWVELGRWFTNPPFGQPDLAAAENVLKRAVHDGIPGALIALARLRWFFRRDDASEFERREIFSRLSRAVSANPADAEALYLLGLFIRRGRFNGLRHVLTARSRGHVSGSVSTLCEWHSASLA